MSDDRHVEPDVLDRPEGLEQKLQDTKESDTPKSGDEPVQPTNARDAEILEGDA